MAKFKFIATMECGPFYYFHFVRNNNIFKRRVGKSIASNSGY